MKETQCQVPCKAQCQAQTQENSEDIYFDYVMSEVASTSVEYVICLQQTKAAKERYLDKLRLFDKQVAKKSKKKTTKIVPCDYSTEFGHDLSDREQQLKIECAEFTNNEYFEYKKLRKKSNYLKSKLVNTVSKSFTLD